MERSMRGEALPRPRKIAGLDSTRRFQPETWHSETERNPREGLRRCHRLASKYVELGQRSARPKPGNNFHFRAFAPQPTVQCGTQARLFRRSTESTWCYAHPLASAHLEQSQSFVSID